MNEKLEKVKVFVKEHKVEIACAVGNQETAISIIPKPKNIEVPEELVKYGVDRIDDYSGAVELMTSYADTGYKVAVEELGKFGEALCKIPDIKPENKAYVLINIAKEIDNN